MGIRWRSPKLPWAVDKPHSSSVYHPRLIWPHFSPVLMYGGCDKTKSSKVAGFSSDFRSAKLLPSQELSLEGRACTCEYVWVGEQDRENYITSPPSSWGEIRVLRAALSKVTGQ